MRHPARYSGRNPGKTTARPSTPLRAAAAAVLGGLLLVVAACGGESASTDRPAAAGGAQTAAPPAATGGASAPAAPALSLAPTELPEAALEALRTALAAYEQCRELLAADRLDGIEPRAARLADSLAMAGQALGGDAEPAAGRYLDEAATAARALGGAIDLGPARAAFGEVSRFLIAVTAADPRLAEGWEVFECPMTDETFGKWLQPAGALGNPYRGPGMASCRNPAEWTAPAPATLPELEAHVDAHLEGVHGGDVAYYTCAMHPSVRRDEPGQCPICGMTLTPVTRQEVASGVILVDDARRQQIGVRTAAVGVEPVTVTVRAVGTVTWDETRLSEVTLKYRGWVGELFVDQTGQPVRRGQPLLTLYSPELLAAQEELLAAVTSQREARLTAAPDRADYLVDAARRRLALWDLSERQIAEVETSGRPVQYVTVHAPASGFVVEKNVVQGAAVEPGAVLYRLAGLDRVWVDAEVYESELPLIEVGQPAAVSFPYLPGETLSGRVGYVYPYLDAASRTGRVRVELANPGLALKPDMYANVVLETPRGERLTVPEEAVIYAGDRRLVFVDLGEGRLQPRRIEVGVRAGDSYEVLSGLAAGEVVVTSGNFLIAAESRLKSALEQW